MSNFIFEYLKFLSSYFGVDFIMVLAIGFQESGFREDQRYRFEPAFYKKYILGKTKYIGYAPRIISSSYGYMQILYTTAEMVGFDLDSIMIKDDRINLYYAVKYLKRCQRIFGGETSTTLSAYNGGVPRRRKVKGEWQYRNQKYIDKVVNIIVKIKKHGIEVEGKKVKI